MQFATTITNLDSRVALKKNGIGFAEKWQVAKRDSSKHQQTFPFLQCIA
jgi:hypothetical protein